MLRVRRKEEGGGKKGFLFAIQTIGLYIKK
jgi:hypothetical protein